MHQTLLSVSSSPQISGQLTTWAQAFVQRVTSLLMVPAGAVASGSHSDSIVQGGAYDGALGVIGAIAAVQVSALI
jgi:hypothetical protein